MITAAANAKAITNQVGTVDMRLFRREDSGRA